MRPLPSPATGPQPDASTTGVSGDSGVESIVQNEPSGVEQRVGVGVQAGERLVGIAGPGGGERAGEVVLLGDQVDGAVAHAARFDEHDLGGVGQHVGEEQVVVDEPRHPALHAVEVDALGEALPLLAAPRLGGDEPGGSLADVVARHQLAGGEDRRPRRGRRSIAGR